jgi:SAM-dependent methyltransferase
MRRDRLTDDLGTGPNHHKTLVVGGARMAGYSRAVTQKRHGLIFDEAPTLYARFRPAYPLTAVDDALSLAGVSAGDAVLEVGAGTGQLTIPLLDRGLRVTALEPGPRMARVLADKVAGRGDVTIIPARFEEAELPAGTFDLVISGTAFHWVDEGRRMRLAFACLRAGGALALLRNDHVAGPGSTDYHRLAQEVYQREAPGLARALDLPTEEQTPWFGPEISASGLFELIEERAYRWTRRYDSRTLVGLLRTYSDHRALPRAGRARLLRTLSTLVDERLGGAFDDHHLTSLSVARRLDPPVTSGGHAPDEAGRATTGTRRR